MKEVGEREWERLTEKQRQKKLVELKLKERQLRREGKLDEIANIIGSHLEDEKCNKSYILVSYFHSVKDRIVKSRNLEILN